MTILITILLFIAILIGFLLFLALITKNNYTIEREIIINKPINEVFNYIILIKNQENYNVWVMKDPNVKIAYQGIDGTEGFTSTWEGNKQAGKGEQEIKKIDNLKSINIEIRFEKPFQNIGQTYMETSIIDENQTVLKYKMTGRNKFPFNLINLFIDGLLGKDLQQSLINMQQILENN
jgi:uncharacterized protein YndB with AHSA1/START domain